MGMAGIVADPLRDSNRDVAIGIAIAPPEQQHFSGYRTHHVAEATLTAATIYTTPRHVTGRK